MSNFIVFTNFSKTESTNTLELEKRLKLKAILIEIMSVMPVVNVDGVISVANTMSSIAANTNEINLAAAV